ncbi:hypothetical protein KL86DPRO_11618 [uncultured delta proteobacterium]|uniref:Uncharacterized protein n=1 Tax=uncultured delta proteobacterium TaxID=34034 RepID=A0A212JJD4_9DELT|nr:hypothetical protein KL86DPRO_11618 [uncultured delta proteobacterium]
MSEYAFLAKHLTGDLLLGSHGKCPARWRDLNPHEEYGNERERRCSCRCRRHGRRGP